MREDEQKSLCKRRATNTARSRGNGETCLTKKSVSENRLCDWFDLVLATSRSINESRKLNAKTDAPLVNNNRILPL